MKTKELNRTLNWLYLIYKIPLLNTQKRRIKIFLKLYNVKKALKENLLKQWDKKSEYLNNMRYEGD